MKKYILLLLLPILAYANIGKISVLKGDVTITRESKITKAHAGTILKKHDYIKTAGNAKVQIIFKDNTIFTIGKNSTLDIADYLYDEATPSKNKAKFNILKGAFTSITGRIGKLNKSKFKLKTKSASIGIRGTVVKANQDTIMCTEGAITVTTPNGMSIDVEAGSKTSVASGTPTPPVTIKAEDEAQIDADITEDDKKASEQQATQEKAKEEKKATKEEATKEEATKEETTQKEEQATENTKNEATSSEATKEETVKNTESTSETIKEKDSVSNQLDKANKGTLSTQTGHTMKDSTSGDDFTVTVDTENKTAVTSKGDSLTVESSDSTMSWGYWNDGAGGVDNKKVWVSGQETSVGILNSLRDSSTQTTHKYSGQSIGNVNMANGSDEAILMNKDNAVNLQFDLGNSQNNMSGNIKFKTKSTSWNADFTGKTTGTSFTSTAISDAGTGNDVQVQSAGSKIGGNFYGNEAQSVGGTFNLNTAEKHTATGVFKATK